ncbi:extracellular solute-binding protein [Paenibacillus eucommiae]|uniref:ABC-type glycerol-3-phosphate transport system substrate-binding protein n=1 Tax=Paenibacillus eucommiae TaxID=1355755 RepID=A0ABS4ILN8_9BACL|nr:extracellular solute-binding protein [Paenibacillus eucommiae]MBP1988487.1 ABC-type glycerol-3-phosphate transport system substrate-binding protein [Paenibacillus eucommiae]
MNIINNFNSKRTIIGLSIFACFLAIFVVELFDTQSAGQQFGQQVSSDVFPSARWNVPEESQNSTLPLYGRLLGQYEKMEYKDYSGQELIYTSESASSQAGLDKGIDGEQRAAAVTRGENGWIEWKVNVKETALYQIELMYDAFPGTRSAIHSSLTIDGKQPFEEASRFVFPRIWEDQRGQEGAQLDNQGNEMRTPQKEIAAWQTIQLEHPEALYKRPYKFLLESGVHTIRFANFSEAMAIVQLTLKPPLNPPLYQDVREDYQKRDLQSATDGIIKIQMEHPSSKSDPILRAEWSDDALAEPSGVKEIRFNTFGGGRWIRGGQSATWKFEVPEDGLYKIGFRYNASGTNPVSRRMIAIDGKIPFMEMEEYAFPAAEGWHADPLKDANNQPYLFYLTKGSHSMSMKAVLGPYRQIIQDLNEVVQELSLLTREVLQVTASSRTADGSIQSDRNRDWELEQQIPNLIVRLSKAQEVLQSSEDNVIELNGGKRPSYVSAISAGIGLLNQVIHNTELIPQKLNELGNMQSAISNAAITMKEQPLQLDYMLVSSPEAVYERSTSTYGESLWIAAGRFVRSFTKDTTKLGGINTESQTIVEEKPALNVWVARGREWVEIMKQMIDEDFTASTGIPVHINTVPGDAEHLLLLAYTAGKAPDVALGVGARIPVEFAVRNAIYDLNQFADIDSIKQRFLPQALIPYQYTDGLYALPETQDFQMLFYRTDILEGLGVKPPQTWQDIYALMPKLLENDMSFYYPDGVAGFYPFLFQNHGEAYKDDGRKSGLDSPEAYQAFKEWTDLYNNYKLQMKADFYQRLRTGEMPIGIGGYELYVRLATAAPELKGRWAMIPLPGKRQSDDTINRSAGGSNNTGIILNATKHPDDAWELLKWWTSKDVQIRFGSEVEGLIGVGSRWNTANVEAMEGMPWSAPELAAIMEQWSWFKELPVVLGGYYTDRHLMNAWNRTVLLGQSPRVALEDAVKEINKELLRKQEEFHSDGGNEP